MTEGPFGYLDGLEPAADAPICDNPSGLYCPDCRRTGLAHCSEPEWCGGMRPMRLAGRAALNPESKP